ncbi:Tripartite motif-containing protein 60 [Sciurus carolinensis]|uniref:Tripartite motif-containing protein 60 n=1 Tax=Sciurus carolinensis TaxID=30640 RepID=A0AA41MH96_SCICA|nr:Tripartite motif-containing protein 60 [Sciurus carolinensis]
MASEASLEELQTEASCPICLGYLTDAVTTECGHNLCRSCIYQHWKDLQDVFPCPVCLHHCLDKKLKGNPQLCNMADIVMQLPDTRSKRRPLCEKHSEVLDLFCEEDLELLCPQCRVSSNHQDHCLRPIDQAATRHRSKLKNYIKLLREQVEDAEMGCEVQVSKSIKLRWEMGNWKRELYHEFEELKHFLGKEQGILQVRLHTQEKIMAEKLVKNKSQISAHIGTLKSLLSEIRETCTQADLDLLRGIRSINSRYTDIKPPAVFSYELKTENYHPPPHYFGLQKMISTFQVDLTLDSQTSHPNLVISADGKSVKCEMKNSSHLPLQPATFYAVVWSYERFGSGRHFWQVEVRGTGEWSLGVCRESFTTKGFVSVCPSNGCWQVGQSTNEWQSAQVKRVGVFLDYELGEVSFYNLNSRSCLCNFTENFRETLVPFFSIESSSKSLTITLVREE